MGNDMAKNEVGRRKRKASGLGRSDLSCSGHSSDQFSRAHIINVAVDRYRPRDERMIANARDIVTTLSLVREGQPIDKFARLGSRTLADVLPPLAIDPCGFDSALSEVRE